MPSIVNYAYSKENIATIKSWHYGTNWPAVYIIYNNESAYIGETLDLARRTEQHLAEDEFSVFTDICLISDKTFNKSVCFGFRSILNKIYGC